jgi:hypothetical protein
MIKLWNLLEMHPVWMSAITLATYHAASAFVGALEMPDVSSTKFYRFFFRFANLFAANYSRSNASVALAQLPPPLPTSPVPQPPTAPGGVK